MDSTSIISMYAQFLDVLDIFENYKTIEEVKNDCKQRKEVYRKYIDELKKEKN